MYDTSIPVIIHGLKSLNGLLTKTLAHCEAKKLAPEAFLSFRLFPDMFPLTRQIQLVTDFAKGCGARLAGQPVPSFADTETTLPELQARIAKTIALLEGFDKSLFKDAATRSVTVRVRRDEELTMTGEVYFNRFVLPNFYFHMTTAYNILRHNGVELGKNDFMGRGI
jgi:uncharacterized protein